MNYTTLCQPDNRPDSDGFYGNFGGAFVPEMLQHKLLELIENYQQILSENGFQEQFQKLLRDYVGRPTPLYEAVNLSKKYGAKILLKREDLTHTGAHKINNTIGQILLAQRLGKKRIIAETGAGQHGVATATVCALMQLECVIYMGAKDMQRQLPNVLRMQMLGAEVRPSKSGSQALKDATNEAIRDWISNPDDTYYIIGSTIGPHPYPDLVAQLQAVISQEIKQQIQQNFDREAPDKVIACVGGGSNAAGAFFHFIENEKVELIGVEASGMGLESGKSAATLHLGSKGILHGCLIPLMQTADGQIIEPHSISAGLDYPGIGPLHAHLFESGRAKYLHATDQEAMAAAFELSRLEGIIPALESAHAFAALAKLKLKKEEIVVVNLSGRGDKDLETYKNHFSHV
ncbi:MAG: tryptophan synthase subunit beta [Bacteroidales bacterium]|jgi:tryptophan synthase beta chain|nr:tryptophan synthase subunit beta [Bacteroidales bacterium]